MSCRRPIAASRMAQDESLAPSPYIRPTLAPSTHAAHCIGLAHTATADCVARSHFSSGRYWLKALKAGRAPLRVGIPAAQVSVLILNQNPFPVEVAHV